MPPDRALWVRFLPVAQQGPRSAGPRSAGPRLGLSALLQTNPWAGSQLAKVKGGA